MIPDELGDYIRRRAHALRISLSETARRGGISRQALYKLLDQSVAEAKLSTFIRLARALNVHPLDLITRSFSRAQLRRSGSRYAGHPGDYSVFVRDVTFPDNDTVLVNQEFEKTWEIQNLGAVEWIHRRIVCMDAELCIIEKGSKEPIPGLGQNIVPVVREVDIPSTAAGGTALISVRFKAPPLPCTTISYWKMVDKNGNICFPRMKGLWCKVNVVDL